MFTKEDIEIINNGLSGEAREKKISDVYGYFVTKVRNNLHVVLGKIIYFIIFCRNVSNWGSFKSEITNVSFACQLLHNRMAIEMASRSTYVSSNNFPREPRI